MKVVLEGTKANDELFSKEVAIKGTWVNLEGYQLTGIDLSLLSQCTILQELTLADNQLTSIDLSPLKQCPQLQGLYLWSNRFINIDLSPLEKCTNLQKLFIWGNPLTSINLSPLKKCTNLLYFRPDSSDTIHWDSPSLDLSYLGDCNFIVRRFNRPMNSI